MIHFKYTYIFPEVKYPFKHGRQHSAVSVTVTPTLNINLFLTQTVRFKAEKGCECVECP